MVTSRGNNLFLIASLAILALFIAACDKNIARPEELAAMTSVSVDELSVGSQTLVAGGDGTTLCWKVTDDDGVLQKVELATDDGSSKTVSEEDCEGINPDHSTMYSVNAYVDGEIAKSKSVYITVLAEDGSEITETPSVSELPASETACDDEEDDDGDDAADCDDSDCAADDACYVAPTYAFSATAFTPQEPLIGDEVTVTWSSNFKFVTVFLNDNMETLTYPAEGEYKFTASGADTVTLKGWGADGMPVDAQIDVAATLVPHTDFEGTFASFMVTPSDNNIIAGESYVISWEVEDARTAQMDTYTGLVGSTDAIPAVAGTYEYVLTAEDNFGNVDSRSLTVTVNGFGTLSDVMGDVSHVEPGEGEDEYYFVGTGGIYYTADALATAPTAIATGGVTGTIMALAVDGEKMYVGTTDGVFYRSGTSGNFKQLLTTGGNAEVRALAVLDDGTVLVGTDEVLYEMNSSHVLTGVREIAGREDLGDFSRDPMEFTQFVHKSADTSVMIVITEADGMFLSTDNGVTFASTGLSDIVGGFAKTGGGTYVWSERQVYEYQSDGGNFEPVGDLDGVTGIRFAAESGGRMFAATDEGVMCGYDGAWFATDFEEDTAFLLSPSSGSLTAVTGTGGISNLTFGATE